MFDRQRERNQLGQLQFPEADLHAGLRDFGRQPLAPEFGHQGVADLDFIVPADEHVSQSAAADEPAVCLRVEHPKAVTVASEMQKLVVQIFANLLGGAFATQRRGDFGVLVHLEERIEIVVRIGRACNRAVSNSAMACME